MSYITEQERQEEFYQKQYKKISNGLYDFMAREQLRQIDVCRAMGFHNTTVRKILDSEPVSLDMVRLLKLISLAGYKIVKKEEEK